jgi:hypothetical protein
MTHYKTSNGIRLSKTYIDRQIVLAKKQKLEVQLEEYSYNFCEECQISGYPKAANEMDLKILDCSHTESVDSCQKNGRCEKAWDLNNIRILCRFHHKKHDKL